MSWKFESVLEFEHFLEKLGKPPNLRRRTYDHSRTQVSSTVCQVSKIICVYTYIQNSDIHTNFQTNGGVGAAVRGGGGCI
jgi:hypothetical protein